MITPEMFQKMLQSRRKTKRLPRQLPPDAIARAYKARLQEMIAQMMRIFRFSAIPMLEQMDNALRLDAIDDDIAQLFDNLQEQFQRNFSRTRAAQQARPIANQLQSYQAAQLNRQLGIPVAGNEQWIEKEIAGFVAQNVALIKSIPQQFLSGLEPLVAAHFAKGGSFDELAQIIEDRYEVAQASAKLIAEDQSNKFFQKVNENRQSDLGISKFVWRTQEDEKVRSAHVARNGKVYSWEGDGLKPGEDVNCRCEAEPYLEDVIAEEGEDDELDDEL